MLEGFDKKLKEKTFKKDFNCCYLRIVCETPTLSLMMINRNNID